MVVSSSGIFLSIDSNQVDFDQLEKYTRVLDRTNKKMKIGLVPNKDMNLIDVINRFKENIYKIDFSKNSELIELPQEIRLLKNLQFLNLNNCSLLTLLPKEVRELKNLEILNLAGTSLTTLPDSIGNLTNLQIISLRHTKIKDYPTHSLI